MKILKINNDNQPSRTENGGLPVRSGLLIALSLPVCGCDDNDFVRDLCKGFSQNDIADSARL